jgi:predicted dehydrogenase
MDRRTFLKVAGGVVVASGVRPRRVWAAAPASGEAKFRTAVIGCGWWGGEILAEALASGRCDVIAVCDPDPNQITRLIKEQSLPDGVKRYRDYRELLEKERPTVVINATPDHWHARITVDAVRGGAHVYVEKPVSHTVMEGVAMVRAARETERVVQVGTHRRVSPHNVSAREFIRAGKVGKIGMVKAFVNYGGGAEKPQENSRPPEGMDWNLWCGPAPLREFNTKIHTRGFRQFLDYANGQLGDWGVHWLDQILWITGEKSPRTVYAVGGRPVRGEAVNDGKAQTSDAPDHQLVTYQFENFDAVWEHRQFAANNAEKGESVGVHFYGTEGTMHVGWQSGWTFYPTDGKKAPLHEDAHLHTASSHNVRELFADFVDAIDKKRRPICDIEEGHRATVCALLGMISMKTGRQLKWDGEKNEIADDPAATALLKRDYRGEWKYPV